MPKLVFRHSPSCMFESELAHGQMSVGRGTENDIMLADQSVSRRHALMERRGANYHVLDLKSKNGVFVNGVRLSEALLRVGDWVDFGSVRGELLRSEESTQDLQRYDRLPRVKALFDDDYDVDRRLGVGSQSEVYLARRRSDGRAVALKVLRGTMAADSESEARFLREGRTLARLRHPCILEILDVDRRGEVPYFALDYLPGGSLEQKLESAGRLSVAATASVGLRLCQGLEAAHAHGVIHRDIKPANIRFDASDRAVLTDFGIAKVIEESALTQSGTVLGTPRYMSPEQFMGGGATAQSDIYSVGATLYHCLAGRLPIEGDSIHELVVRATNPEVVVPPIRSLAPNVPGALASLLDQTLDRDPERRPRAVGELCRVLAAIA